MSAKKKEEALTNEIPSILLEETSSYPYITADLTVAAYLTMEGYSVHSVAREEGNNRASFVFMSKTQEDKKALQSSVREFHNNKGRFRLFSDCWRNVKGMVHNL